MQGIKKIKILNCTKFGWGFFLPKACDFNIKASHPKGNNLINVQSFS